MTSYFCLLSLPNQQCLSNLKPGMSTTDSLLPQKAKRMKLLSQIECNCCEKKFAYAKRLSDHIGKKTDCRKHYEENVCTGISAGDRRMIDGGPMLEMISEDDVMEDQKC